MLRFLIWSFACILSLSALSNSKANAQSEARVDRLKNVDTRPAVRVDYFIDRDLHSLGEIIDSYRQANYLSNQDRVYISTKDPVSVGDRFTIVRDEGRVARRGIFGRVSAHRYSVRGYARVTQVFEDAIEAQLMNAADDIQKGDLLIPYRENIQYVKAQEPKEDVRGKILAGAQDTSLIGAYELSFIDKGEASGLKLNDRLTVYRRATEGSSGSNSVEIPIATLVIVDLSKDYATAYTLASVESFEPGALFKSDISEVRYLD